MIYTLRSKDTIIPNTYQTRYKPKCANWFKDSLTRVARNTEENRHPTKGRLRNFQQVASCNSRLYIYTGLQVDTTSKTLN